MLPYCHSTAGVRPILFELANFSEPMSLLLGIVNTEFIKSEILNFRTKIIGKSAMSDLSGISDGRKAQFQEVNSEMYM